MSYVDHCYLVKKNISIDVSKVFFMYVCASKSYKNVSVRVERDGCEILFKVR